MARNRMGPQISAPGHGDMASAMTKIQQAIGLLQEAQMGLPPGQRLHTDVNRAVGTLSRHLGGAGGMAGPGAGVQKTSLTDQLRDTVRNMMLHRILSMQKPPQGADQSPAGPAPPGGPPMPSTPLPGA
jgi:hypothetical protein